MSTNSERSSNTPATFEEYITQTTVTSTSEEGTNELVRQKEPSRRPNMWISWWQEILFCVTGIVSFLGIVITLYLYNQEAPPQWPIDLTLNSLLALLSTICKASFMVSLAEVMGQWKWNMFSDAAGRPLHDFTLLDLASRGFWGSCALVGRFRWRHPVTIAGVISIFSVLTSPITQQALEYQTRSEGSHGLATLGISRGLPGIKHNLGVTSLDIAVQKGAYTSLQDPPRPLEAVCTTANCTFPPYESLAVCVRTADVSTLLNTSTVRPDGHPQYTIAGEDADPASLIYTTLPNNLVFDTPVPYAFRSQPGNTTLKFKQDEAYKTALVNFFVIYTKRGGGDDPSAASGTDPVKVEFRALEVLLYLCVNSYNTVVTDGQSRTDVISSVSTVIITDDTDKPEIAKTQCVNPPSAEGGAGELHCLDTGDKDGNITLAGGSASAGVRSSSEPLADDRKFTSDILSLRQMTGSIVFSLFGQYERNDSSPVVTNMSSLWLWDALYGSYGNITDPEEQLSRAHEYYSGLATSLTNALRTIDSAYQLKGTAWQDKIYLNVRWGWLSFLAVELLLATSFVAFTIIVTRMSSTHVLKTSVLAAMLVPSKGLKETVGTVEDLDGAAKVTMVMQVKFDNKILSLVGEGEDYIYDDSGSSSGAPTDGQP